MNTRIFLIVLLVSTFFISCKKTEIVHENKIITGNVPPPYQGVTTIQIQNYINKLFIDLIGDEPSDAELTTLTDLLITNNLEEATRITVIEDILAKVAHRSRYWTLTSVRYIGGFDKDYLTNEKALYEYLSVYYKSLGDTFTSFVMDYEVIRLDRTLTADTDLGTGAITISEYVARFCNNVIYDEINMGTTNFVLACFENMFFRTPTVEELTQSETMVNGSPATLFLSDGKSKGDFLKIVTGSDEFFQGMAVEAYNFLLARDPETLESNELTEKFKTSNDYKDLYIEICKTDEYAGF